MIRLARKIRALYMGFEDLRTNVFFQALPEENKRDYQKVMDAFKTFIDNLTTKTKKQDGI